MVAKSCRPPIWSRKVGDAARMRQAWPGGHWADCGVKGTPVLAIGPKYAALIRKSGLFGGLDNSDQASNFCQTYTSLCQDTNPWQVSS